VSVVVVLPTYNEAENIERLLVALRESVPQATLLVVDDSSPDGTGRIADECAASSSQIEVVHRAGKEGLGSAYRHGFAWALERGFDVIVSMDSDFSHDPKSVPDLLAAVEAGADAAVGSRYVSGGGTRDWPLHRRLLSRWGNLYTGWILGVEVRDCTSGFRAYRGPALGEIAPQTTKAEGYAFLTELVLRLRRRGFRVTEVPITFVDRRYGTSKMSGRIIAESMILVTRWGLGHRVTTWRDALRRLSSRRGS
jgi:dolichol-phosphate mannosyltransferase